MTNEELMTYALKGMRADVTEKAARVKDGMTRMKEAFDRSPVNGAARMRFKPVIDNLMEALVAFDEAMESAERASRATYTKEAQR